MNAIELINCTKVRPSPGGVLSFAAGRPSSLRRHLNGACCARGRARSGASAGFTLLELVAVLAMLGLLLVVLSPALARTKPDTYAITCRNNLAQLTKAWTMYAEDNSGSLVYNHDGSMAGRSQSTASWVAGWLDFTTSPDNTNINYLVQHSNQYAWCGFFGSYLRNAAPFKCPADRSVVTGSP